ncbi:MAG: ATP-dependent 6-phosphofructokinase [Verrucomicrobiales bacterium]|nr:ATP-dependent 6-phosphofructokinase [Verrucomicrobiales bacterium]MCP5526717.1 ATP-dependent 6-phosphofructokinase [Verrucomicrobiales bacterium]
MPLQISDFAVHRLGPGQFASPMRNVPFVDDARRVLYHAEVAEVRRELEQGLDPLSFEIAGPREQLFFDPGKVRAGIVTCGGLCPGLNDVIRAIVLSLEYHYGVPVIHGFRYGYEGLIEEYGHEPLRLDTEEVDHIEDLGGTILGSSRGPQDVGRMIDRLEQLGVSMLFVVGGDGTLRGGRDMAEEIARRGAHIAVIGVPKTIDNDIGLIQMSFGFQTAVAEAGKAIAAAHVEAKGARNGIGLVKLMGRHSGFIAAHAALASSQVNFCLIPESRFSLEAFLRALQDRIEHRHHAVIVVAEGAGQDLMEADLGRDASGNSKLGDIGVFLRDRIRDHFKRVGVAAGLKYIDPSYMIRGVPANAFDSAFCLLLGHNAVHAAMSGRTNTVVGFWRNEFTHVPIPLATAGRKQVEPDSRLWSGVLASTGQPRDLS